MADKSPDNGEFGGYRWSSLSFDRIEFVDLANSRGGRILMFGRYVVLREQ